MSRIAIMQGRLLPPEADRFQCFPARALARGVPPAAAAGLDAIEWIYDLHGADVNPLATDEGIAEMRALSRAARHRGRSVCADYFMDRPFVARRRRRNSRNSSSDLLLAAGALPHGRHSAHGAALRRCLPHREPRIRTTAWSRMLRSVLPYADGTAESNSIWRPRSAAARVRRAAGAAAAPAAEGQLRLRQQLLAGLRRAAEEFAAYGAHRQRTHQGSRPRRRHGAARHTAMPRSPALVRWSRPISLCSGDYILQVARGDAGDEVEWAQREPRSTCSQRLELTRTRRSGEPHENPDRRSRRNRPATRPQSARAARRPVELLAYRVRRLLARVITPTSSRPGSATSRRNTASAFSTISTRPGRIGRRGVHLQSQQPARPAALACVRAGCDLFLKNRSPLISTGSPNSLRRSRRTRPRRDGRLPTAFSSLPATR